MNRLLCALLVTLWFSACSDQPSAEVDSARDHEGSPEEAPEGAHGGRLLSDGDFQIELAIFEEGVPPEFRAYGYERGKALRPASIDLAVDLTRLDGQVDRFAFAPREDYLRGDGEVREPHSFTVKVRAAHGAKSHEWSYDAFEGRTRIGAQMAQGSGIEVEPAGPARIRETLTLHGTIVPDPQRVFRLHPRYPGVVREVRKQIGERVSAGEVLAVIESNESLQRYNVVAPASGVVVTRDANPGVAIDSEPILTLVDLSTVWVELASFQQDLGRIKRGQPVLIHDVDGVGSAEGRVDSIGAVGSAASQSMTVRVVLPNRDDHWRPGLFVTGEVTVSETDVPLAVRRSALQTFRDWTVVFEQVGDLYEVRPLELGRADREWSEVREGLKPGARYVTANSFLIKADIEKSGASHDH